MTDALNTISTAAIMFIVASGLGLIFGLMRVINMGHPAWMAIGAYTTLAAVGQGYGFWAGVIAAALVAGTGSILIEMLIIRRLYLRPSDTVLATWGIALVIFQAISTIFGRGPQPLDAPFTGIVDLAGISYSEYRLALIGLALLLVAILVFVSRYTDWGLVARAVMADERLAAGMGVNTLAVRQGTFVLGSALAAAAGGLVAPLATVTPMTSFSYLGPGLLTVLLSGNSVLGLVVASGVVAGGDSLFSRFVDPTLASAFGITVAVLILRFIPDGFAGFRRIA